MRITTITGSECPVGSDARRRLADRGLKPDRFDNGTRRRLFGSKGTTRRLQPEA